MFLTYRHPASDLLCISTDWFLYDKNIVCKYPDVFEGVHENQFERVYENQIKYTLQDSSIPTKNSL